ncbi:hypothetical protein B1757_02515 [Acidithiobacillus marinus]|uniref:Uncharacterized protein n=1 Tax=Acidithiobacillus marinus TaxID=187490 RepID=A0A2I1DPS4_9PROT|nr:hypothetical protein B1757_02515 [Acidithiobacillus marinus]
MTTPKTLKGSLVRQLLYSVAGAVLTWLVAMLIVIWRDHFMGYHPGHIAWLAAQPLPWTQTIHQALHIAGIWAVIALGVGLLMTVAINVVSGLVVLLGMASTRGKGGRA